MAHHITVAAPTFEIFRTDLVVSVETDGGIHGDLFISQGSIDWRTKYQRGSTIVPITWERFDAIMRAEREGRLAIADS